MANRLYHTLLAVSAVSVNSAAAGYPATNVTSTPVDRQWRSTSVGGSEFVTIDLGSSKAVSAIGVNEVNWTGATVKADNLAVPTTVRGTLNTYVDHQGRRKGSLEFSATVRYIRIELPASVTDGAAFHRLGFCAPFASAIDLARDLLFGSSLDHLTPQLSVPLVNGQELTVDTGAPRTLVDCKSRGRATHDIEALKRYARSGPVWLNCNLVGQEFRQWPVRSVEPSSRRSIEGVNREGVDLRLRECA
jgi:hypothetical protein